MDFYEILEEYPFEGTGESFTPFAGKVNGKWVEGTVNIDFLNEHFGYLKTGEEMKNATETESLKLYFGWLKEQELLN